MSSLQLLGPFSVWQLTMTCVIAASLRLESARCRSRMPFCFGSTLATLTAVGAVVPGGGARTSSAPSAFFGSVGRSRGALPGFGIVKSRFGCPMKRAASAGVRSNRMLSTSSSGTLTFSFGFGGCAGPPREAARRVP